MTNEAEAICDTCGRPVAKAGSMTQWIFDTSRCNCSAQPAGEVARCVLCGLPVKSKIGSITQWIFKPKVCSCLISYDTDGFLDPSALPEDESILGAPYHFLGVTGRGGVGTVYKAQNKKLSRFVAIKVLQMGLEDTRASQNFEREARACSRLNHPNIVTVQDFGNMSDGRQFLVYEWIEGVTLAQYLSRSGRLPLEVAQDVFIQVLDGLSHAHKKSVIHRDIKPDNIMLTRGEYGGWIVKIIDFGTAKEIDNQGELTRAEDLACSPFYMSPEQSFCSTLDHRTDLYSLGCSLFEALTGKPPFTGKPLTILMRHQSEAPPTLAVASGGVQFPEYIEQVVARLLAKEPSDRYESAEDVKAALVSKHRTEKASIVSVRATPAFLFPTLTFLLLIPIVVSITMLIAPPMEHPKTQEKREPFRSEKHAPRLSSMPLASAMAGSSSWMNMQGEWTDIVGNSLAKIPASKVKELKLVEWQGLEGLDRFQNLDALALSTSQLEPGDVEQIVKLPKLHFVKISAVRIPHNTCERIATLPRLENFELASCELTKEHCLAMSTMKSLKTLNLGECGIANRKWLFPLKNLQKLEFFGAGHIAADDDLVSFLPYLPRLSNVDISQSRLTVEGWKSVARCRNLSSMRAAISTLDDRGARELAKMENLIRADLRTCGITDAGLMDIARIATLRQLDVEGCTKITSEGVAKARAANPEADIKFAEIYGIQEMLPSDQELEKRTH